MFNKLAKNATPMGIFNMHKLLPLDLSEFLFSLVKLFELIMLMYDQKDILNT